MVGRGRRFHSARPAPGRARGSNATSSRRPAGRGVTLRWLRDSGTGNSDHREFELAGLPGVVVQTLGGRGRCYHTACDGWRRLEPAALARVQGIAESVLRRG